MGRRGLTGALLLIALTAAAAAAQQPVFRSGTELVDLFVTVTDDTGRLVPGLLQEDFAIFDEGEPQEIVLFESDVRPITVVVMLDTSASMTLNLDLLMAGAEQFLIRMLPEDRGKVGAFNAKIQILPETGFTGDRDELIDVLDDLQFGNPTRLYDAVAAGIEELKDIEGRRVVLVFTDGENTLGDTGWRDVVERARVEDVMIYAIGMEAEYHNGIRQTRTEPDGRLADFAQETGGGYFELKHTDELGPTFTRVAQELHSQYVLGFAPTKVDGKVHELEVRMKQRGMRARARKTYQAEES